MRKGVAETFEPGMMTKKPEAMTDLVLTGTTKPVANGSDEPAQEVLLPQEAFNAWFKTPDDDLPPDLSYDDWRDWGRGLRARSSKLQWKIVRWLMYGERKYGEKYVQAAEETGYDKSYLMHLLSIGSATIFSREKVSGARSLPFSYFRHICASEIPPDHKEAMLRECVRRKDLQTSRRKWEAYVKDYRTRHGLLEGAKPEFNGGLSKGAEDDGLPIPPHGVKREEKDEVDDLIAKGEALLVALPEEERTAAIEAFLESKTDRTEPPTSSVETGSKLVDSEGGDSSEVLLSEGPQGGPSVLVPAVSNPRQEKVGEAGSPLEGVEGGDGFGRHANDPTWGEYTKLVEDYRAEAAKAEMAGLEEVEPQGGGDRNEDERMPVRQGPSGHQDIQSELPAVPESPNAQGSSAVREAGSPLEGVEGAAKSDLRELARKAREEWAAAGNNLLTWDEIHADLRGVEGAAESAVWEERFRTADTLRDGWMMQCEEARAEVARLTRGLNEAHEERDSLRAKLAGALEEGVKQQAEITRLRGLIASWGEVAVELHEDVNADLDAYCQKKSVSRQDATQKALREFWRKR